jgi:hypothetical protein
MSPNLVFVNINANNFFGGKNWDTSVHMFQKVAQSKLLVPIDENSMGPIWSPCSLLTCRHLRVNMLH